MKTGQMALRKIIHSLMLASALSFALAPALHGLHLAVADHGHCHQAGGGLCAGSRLSPMGLSLGAPSMRKPPCPLCQVFSAIHQHDGGSGTANPAPALEAAGRSVEDAPESPHFGDACAPCSRGPPESLTVRV